MLVGCLDNIITFISDMFLGTTDLYVLSVEREKTLKCCSFGGEVDTGGCSGCTPHLGMILNYCRPGAVMILNVLFFIQLAHVFVSKA
jgi:hypothetical protein